jgi:amino-acid N-acetyltransferase
MSESSLRQASVKDVPAILSLIDLGVSQGVNLPRSQNYVFQNLRDFVIAERGEHILGCASLHVLWKDFAELRAVAMIPDEAANGLLRRMVDYLADDGRRLGVSQVLAFAFNPEAYVALGFREVAKETLPQIAWRECMNCVYFPDCKESAVILNLDEVPEGASA